MIVESKVASYGVRKATSISNSIEQCVEQVKRNGFTLLDSGLTSDVEEYLNSRRSE